ncbi:neugrin isoform X2 [Parambassis ranga]|nr:neugrin isoform X2 [Parambassis ranga]
MDEESGEELELEDAEDRFQALLDEGRKRQRTVKFNILRRQMTPSGPPPRKLTWDAIEQIRYLKQEEPEEWTVERLAEAYSVTPDVILRVLRSKFVPSPERKSKQNAKVMAGLSQQTLTSGAGSQKNRQNLLGLHAQAVLPPRSSGGALVPVAKKTQLIQGEGSGLLVKSPVPITLVPAPFTADNSINATLKESTEEDPTRDEDEEDSWDGQVLTEEELEQFMEIKSSSVVQVGSEFFDAEGNFLYRI